MILLLVVTESCTRPGGVSDRQIELFVKTYADLARASETCGADTSAYLAAKDSILRHHGVDERFLLEFAEAISGKPELQKEIFSRVVELTKDTTESKQPRWRRSASP